MANTFKVKTVNNVGTSDSDVYTCPSATQTTIIGMNLANITTSAVAADITLVNNDGPNVSIVKGAPIPAGGSLELIDGGSKVVMMNGDTLKAQASKTGSIDAVVSFIDTISE